MTRGYVATIHYNKPGSRRGLPWTVHYRGKCHLFAEVRISGTAATVHRPDKKTNPRSWLRIERAVLCTQPGQPGLGLVIGTP